MEASIIAIFVMMSVMFLMIGGIIGWLAQQNNLFVTSQTMPSLHPEMYDENGNILPDEILAVRFENEYDDYEENDDAS
jgi:membrane protease subunit (stomatin/prohibitin family)